MTPARWRKVGERLLVIAPGIMDGLSWFRLVDGQARGDWAKRYSTDGMGGLRDGLRPDLGFVSTKVREATLPTADRSFLVLSESSVFDIPDVFAGFGTDLRCGRQAQGITPAWREGLHRGRPPKIDMASGRARVVQGRSPTWIVRGTVCRARFGERGEIAPYTQENRPTSVQ